MAVKIAEYYGQRVDIDINELSPIDPNIPQPCPFMDSPCSKMSGRQKYKPICSVRKPDNTLWIVCEHRLCSSRKNKKVVINNKTVTRPSQYIQYQKDILHNIGKTVFGEESKEENIYVSREARVKVIGGSNYSADYLLLHDQQHHKLDSPNQLIVEMQGGGETTDTGEITRHVAAWEENPNKSNSLLREIIPSAGTLETNAWRRQQEQFLAKGSVAIKSGGGIVFCLGSLTFDYLKNRVGSTVPDMRNKEWNLALIGFKEGVRKEESNSPIPIELDKERLLFTTLDDFLNAIISGAEADPNLFKGSFHNLKGETTAFN